MNTPLGLNILIPTLLQEVSNDTRTYIIHILCPSGVLHTRLCLDHSLLLSIKMSDIGISGCHGFYHEGACHIAHEGQSNEEEGTQDNACITKGLGEGECSNTNYQVEDVNKRKLYGEITMLIQAF